MLVQLRAHTVRRRVPGLCRAGVLVLSVMIMIIMMIMINNNDDYDHGYDDNSGLACSCQLLRHHHGCTPAAPSPALELSLRNRTASSGWRGSPRSGCCRGRLGGRVWPPEARRLDLETTWSLQCSASRAAWAAGRRTRSATKASCSDSPKPEPPDDPRERS